MLAKLIQNTWWRFIATAFSSILFGVISVSLVALINEIINGTLESRAEQFTLFAILACLGVVLQLVSRILAEQLSELSQATVRQQVAEHVIGARFSHVEAQGAGKIKSCLTEHSLRVAEFFQGLPNILSNGMIVLGSFVYMAWLDWQVFVFAMLTLILGSVGYSLANATAFRKVSEAASIQDALYEQFDAIYAGAKELKLHREKRITFLNQVIGDTITLLQKRRVQGASIYHYAASWGGFSVFAFIGGALFYLSGQAEDTGKVMSGFALLFLYMLTPLEVMLGAIPKAAAAKASANTIATLTEEMALMPHSDQAMTTFEQLTLKDISHGYYHEQSDEVFALTPINLTLRKGELVYLVGGNGSGKTTFAKLLCGLYEAQEGQIQVDNQVLETQQFDDYRQLFSTVFSDFYLFDRVLGCQGQDLEDKGNALIRKLNLHHKVAIKDGAFTTQKLSQGQRKRLALVVAYMEDRPFYIFDEWAADQDPVFKEVFYRELLPELSAQGKTVLVITHDDKYFALADRLLKMDNGCLSEAVQVAPQTPAKHTEPA
ncbi:cyclic peptide export ABC transporter [Pseudoalteromonas rubra]|uniref:Cyclic peptide export ABC transporter n=1 Tax=Pseudoalteromonas rubra TaxID=43658 RepID=A0A5S3WQ11_9GAMM|nr:cyclic peptide export ABC transporter [Pseudoalteromonas rubra]TMP30008.1 cyclic peptide export ABC transporter [Pseudoalteromonas rubra]TMP30588.1 cyclic peptide export ABC transporter [Pseudoalteromonas rubra]